MNKDCNVIIDLLPLYTDNVCSEESREFVQDHITNCKDCMSLLEDIKQDIQVEDIKSLDDQKENELFNKFIKGWEKSLFKSFIKGICIAVALFILVLGSWYLLFNQHTSKVARDDVIISGYVLNQDHITFRMQLTDGYQGGNIKTVEEDGKLYIIIYRTIIKEKLKDGEDEIMDYGFNQQIKNIDAVYYGTPDSASLIWQKGNMLPSIDEEFFN